MTDPNLIKIKEANMYNITHGSVETAISQAESYLNYVLGHDIDRINDELEDFASEVKEVRKQSRYRKRQKGRKLSNNIK